MPSGSRSILVIEPAPPPPVEVIPPPPRPVDVINVVGSRDVDVTVTSPPPRALFAPPPPPLPPPPRAVVVPPPPLVPRPDRIYVVVAGDLEFFPGTIWVNPFAAAHAIAARFGLAQARINWWPSLRDANPQKAVNPRTGWWYAVRAGERIRIPRWWPRAMWEPVGLVIEPAPPPPVEVMPPPPRPTNVVNVVVPPEVGIAVAPPALVAPPPVVGTLPAVGRPERIYLVVAGDLEVFPGTTWVNPFAAARAVAARFGLVQAGINWWPSLRDANPQKNVNPKTGWWYAVRAGERIRVPRWWPRAVWEPVDLVIEPAPPPPVEVMPPPPQPADVINVVVPPEADTDIVSALASQSPPPVEVMPPAPPPAMDVDVTEDAWGGPCHHHDWHDHCCGWDCCTDAGAPERLYRVSDEDFRILPGRTWADPASVALTIARRFGAGADWWPALLNANPQKPVNMMTGYWVRIDRGEIIRIPGWWPRAPWEPVDVVVEPPPPPDVRVPVYGSGDEGWADRWRWGDRGGDPRWGWRDPWPVRGPWSPRDDGEWWRRETGDPDDCTPCAPCDPTPPDDVEPPAYCEVPNPPSPGTGGAATSLAGSARQNTTQRTYAVVAGDGMFKIAQKFGAGGRPHWLRELDDANPSKAVNARNEWTSLNPGELINIPDAWTGGGAAPPARPAPGGAPTPYGNQGLGQMPRLPGGLGVPAPMAPPGTVPAAATVDKGTFLRVQGVLALWGRQHPEAAALKDFGLNLADVTDVPTERTKEQLASFQRWHNATGATPRLREDGVIEPTTIAALDRYQAASLGAAAPAGPMPGPFGHIPAHPAAPRPGESTDPWSEVWNKAAHAVESVLGGAPPAKPGAAAPAGPLDGVLGSLSRLPDLVAKAGVPGAAGLPHGAPHRDLGPPPAAMPPRVDAALTPPAAEPAELAAPPPKKKGGDAGALGLLLTGLGIASGFFGF